MLGHTGARALATRGRAPPVQHLVALLIANQSLNGRVSYASLLQATYASLRYDLRTDLGGCKIPKFSGEGCPQIPLKASALHAEVYINVVCPWCALA